MSTPYQKFVDKWFNTPSGAMEALKEAQDEVMPDFITGKPDQGFISKMFEMDYPDLYEFKTIVSKDLQRSDLVAGIMSITGRTKASLKDASRPRLMALFDNLYRRNRMTRMAMMINLANRNDKTPNFYKNLSDVDLMTMEYEIYKWYVPKGVVIPKHLKPKAIKPKAVKPKAIKPKAVKPKASSVIKPKASSSGKRIPLLKAIAEKTGTKRVYKNKSIAELKKMLDNLSRPQKFREQEEEKEEFRPPSKRKPVGRRPIAPIGPPAGGLPPPAPPSRTIKELKNSLRKYNEENCEKLAGNKATLLAKARKRGI